MKIAVVSNGYDKNIYVFYICAAVKTHLLGKQKTCACLEA